MFDVLELYVPSLVEAGFRRVQRRTAWGPADEMTLEWNGLPFARPLGSTPASANVTSWTGLTLAREAAAAATNDRDWTRYREAVRAVLDAHEQWLLLVEADGDQHPMEHLELTVSEAIDRLDTQRRAPRSSLAMRVTSRRI